MIKQQRQTIKRLKAKLEAIQMTAQRYENEAKRRQAGGNLPRAAWSYLKAVRRIAAIMADMARP